jgi:hypothetical protein
MTRRVRALVAAVALSVPVEGASGSDASTSTIGLPVSLDFWLPGPKVFAAAVDDRRSPVVVRIDKATAERNGHRYSLVYTGLEAGRFDLRDSLRGGDGTPPRVPPIPVEVRGLRRPGDIRLHRLTESPAARVGGYRSAVIAAGVLWLLGLAGLIAARPRRRRGTDEPRPQTPTPEGRLRELLTAAIGGTATPTETAELERGLLAYWVRRLGLKGRDPASLFAALGAHPEAGPFLRQFEGWLHAPRGSAAPANVPGLLSPYRERFAEHEGASRP